LSHSHPSHPAIAPLSLHDALPIWVMRHSWLRSSASKKPAQSRRWKKSPPRLHVRSAAIQIPALLHAAATPPATPPLVQSWNLDRSEEHTSELQSRFELVCRLLLEK